MEFTCRQATTADIHRLGSVMDAAISELQNDVLSADQVESSRAIMGIDTQLIADGTYFVVEHEGQVAGCGGWSRRATLYGSDSTPGRDARLLDPASEAARVRAMYTNPAYARRGVGRLILTLCEEAAASEGFTHLELMGTMSGQRLYEACGFKVVEKVEDSRGGAAVPLVKMVKAIESVPRSSGRIEGVPEPLTHAASITIAAPPSVVYAAVSDVTRTGEWSPVCQECWWDDGDGPQVGSFFTGRNVTPTRTWETRSEVILAEPDRTFGWSVAGGVAHWIYSLESIDGGTLLTESWVFTEKGQEVFVERYGDSAPQEIAARTTAAHQGIPITLAAIKRVIELPRT